MSHTFTKKQCQSLHFRKRFQQRFGIAGDKSIQEMIMEKVLNGRCSLYLKQSNRISILDTNIDINGESTWIRFVYDSKAKQVVTVFPNDENNRPIEAKFLTSEKTENIT